MRKGIGPRKLGSPLKQVDSIKVAHQKGIAQDIENTRALNENLRAAREAYQENRNPETKAALEEAKDMKRGGSTFSTKGRVSNRRLGEDYPA